MPSTATDTPGILGRIERARRELLDLSARNRLISTPLGPSRGRKVEVVGERTDEVFRLLVVERKAMSFLPGEGEEDAPGPDARATDLAQPGEDGPAGGVPDPRHTDLRLQTRLKSEALQGRLLAIYYDAQTYEQEQGASILYLAAGFLRWYESASSDKARYAPLLLLPVDLERRSAANRFQVRLREEDIATNLSLRAKLRAEFGVDLPEVPDVEELVPSAYFDAVSRAVAAQPRWEVLRDEMVLWFFSFAKYLMYRDLDPDNWPAHAPLGNNPTLAHLLGDGFPSEPPLVGESDKIDPLIPPEVMVHVTDADSSQAAVIEEVRRGRHLVVQGPPGTGKSQTITNLIAGAVREGKTVLFVAEKMAALEVVRGRLVRLGLGPVGLELHSSKANKKSVLEDLARTLALGRPQAAAPAEVFGPLRDAIARLNRHAEVLNTPLVPAGVTPFQIIGQLASLEGRAPGASSPAVAALESWTPAGFRERLLAIEDLRAHLAGLGPPGDHPWRGVNRSEAILPSDRHALLAEVAETIVALESVGEAAARLAEALEVPPPGSPGLDHVQGLAELALRIVKAPPMDRPRIADPAWATHREAIAGLVARGADLAARRAALEATVADVAWGADLAPTRRTLAARGRSLFRWLYRDYREAVATLRGILKGKPPRSPAARLALVDALIAVQSDTRSLDDDPACTQLGRDAFGEAWRGSRSDWPALAVIVAWEAEAREAGLPHDPRLVLSRLERPDACNVPLEILSDRLKAALARLEDLRKALALDPAEAFGGDLLAVPIGDIVARLRRWSEHPESLSSWIGYRMRCRRLAEAGLGEIAADIHDGRIPAAEAADRFRAAYFGALIRGVFRRHPELAEFDGGTYERWVEEFRALDLARIAMARGEVAAAHFDAIPRGSGGEMAVIRREIEKKRRHKPIRVLLREAGTAVQAIKPVFLMSPVSVAQFLEPGALSFDLMIVDEASQVSPVDALGAIARARQVVVVGDDKQLPPTRFFSKILDDDSPSADDDGADAADLESVLGLCVAQGMPQRMLRWHYRSRHHSLIAVSNREFYDDGLHVIPSPTATTATHGLHFRRVEGGVFDRGGTATNRVEARAVAEAVVEHARSSPGKSLGVGCFSVAQRDAIRDELELLQRQDPDLSGFFSPGRDEPFFVKNLENIQGDERDVIFISVGYARDASGSMAMNFGPLSTEGGERRLNVLISRARERCEVFASITHDDIDLDRARSRGAAAFKTFLRYAATGVLERQAPTGGDTDSDFERQVAVALRALGNEVHCRVGTAGFLIDLAVVDPTCPGRYLLGIECDGATYHASRSARDRDRLREAVLRDRGWTIHRIWSADWFHRPAEQLRKVADAIERARAEVEPGESPLGEAAAEPVPVAEGPVEIDRAPSDGTNGAASAGSWIVPYVEAAMDVPSDTPIPETHPSVLAAIVARVVEVEGPIHREEIARRITTLWGQQRTGGRIAEATSQAIDAAIGSGAIRGDAEFVTHARMTVVPVRSRELVSSAGLRRPEMLPPAEIREAILRLASEHVGVGREEISAMVAMALGFRSTGAKLREAVDTVAGGMIEDGSVILRDEKLYLP
ncbi:MAG TPA: DUF3320 domain-containing protein [Isosphaeraceae bacterium]